jgi:hypothetical protein
MAPPDIRIDVKRQCQILLTKVTGRVSFRITGRVSDWSGKILVGVAGFEPATPSSRTRCATIQNAATPRLRATMALISANGSSWTALRVSPEIREITSPCFQKRRGRRPEPMCGRHIGIGADTQPAQCAIQGVLADRFPGPPDTRRNIVLPTVSLTGLAGSAPPLGQARGARDASSSARQGWTRQLCPDRTPPPRGP